MKILKTIDIYIIRKFIGTYFFSLLLMICIFIIVDVSEKISDFVNKGAPLEKIILEYYLQFIPFFLNTFSSLFVFIAVIFFTSKMAFNTEIIAILASGVSFRRMLRPYFISAAFIFLLSFFLNHFVIPPATKIRLNFENTYIKGNFQRKTLNLHLQDKPGLYVYMSNFSGTTNTAYNFSLEQYEDRKLISKIMCDYAVCDTSSSKWTLHNYIKRDLLEMGEVITEGAKLDTILNFEASELKQRDNIIKAMDYFELKNYIAEQRMRGVKVEAAILEEYTRTSIPFSVFVLTLIGVSLSSRKVRGGIGLQLGIGITLSFTYILLLKFSEMFIQVGIATPFWAAWLPNILFLLIAIGLYRTAQK